MSSPVANSMYSCKESDTFITLVSTINAVVATASFLFMLCIDDFIAKLPIFRQIVMIIIRVTVTEHNHVSIETFL